LGLVLVPLHSYQFQTRCQVMHQEIPFLIPSNI
jgi:hypothetical protein